MPRILVATRGGLHEFDERGEGRQMEHAGRAVVSLARARSTVWALVDASELWRSTASGWERVTELTGFRALCITAFGDDVFVGSSEAHLFRLAASRLERIEAFDRVEGRSAWYTPWGGPPDTRSMANWDDDVYVNVHVGGIPRTDDGGASWTPTIDVDADVHHLTTAEGLVLAACAGGLASSRDRGAKWIYRTDGLEAPYARAVAVCGDALLMSASNGPRGGYAAVYRGAIGDGPFERSRTGLPEWFDDNIDTYCLDALPDGAIAAFGTTDGRLFVTRNQAATWDLIASGLPRVERVLVMP